MSQNKNKNLQIDREIYKKGIKLQFKRKQFFFLFYSVQDDELGCLHLKWKDGICRKTSHATAPIGERRKGGCTKYKTDSPLYWQNMKDKISYTEGSIQERREGRRMEETGRRREEDI